jgi:hypothetical protein
MNAPTKIRPEFLDMFDPKELEFDPTNPDAPAEGDGLPLIKHNVYDCIELCCDDHQAGCLLFKMIFYCRRATLTPLGTLL